MEWKGLGLALRLHPGTLDTIEADCRDVQSRLREVLTQWLKKDYDTRRFGAPSWQLLVAAVAHPAGGNNPALAHTIAHNHNGRFSSVQYDGYEIMGQPGGKPEKSFLVLFDSAIFADILSFMANIHIATKYNGQCERDVYTSVHTQSDQYNAAFGAL